MSPLRSLARWIALFGFPLLFCLTYALQTGAFAAAAFGVSVAIAALWATNPSQFSTRSQTTSVSLHDGALLATTTLLGAALYPIVQTQLFLLGFGLCLWVSVWLSRQVAYALSTS